MGAGCASGNGMKTICSQEVHGDWQAARDGETAGGKVATGRFSSRRVDQFPQSGIQMPKNQKPQLREVLIEDRLNPAAPVVERLMVETTLIDATPAEVWGRWSPLGSAGSAAIIGSTGIAPAMAEHRWHV